MQDRVLRKKSIKKNKVNILIMYKHLYIKNIWLGSLNVDYCSKTTQHLFYKFFTHFQRNTSPSFYKYVINIIDISDMFI